jgi:hypothetical protein
MKNMQQRCERRGCRSNGPFPGADGECLRHYMSDRFWHDSDLELRSKNDRFGFNSGPFAVNFCYRTELVCCLPSSGLDVEMARQPPLT